MTSMRLRFIVTTFNEHGDSLSEHKYADKQRAQCKFERAVHTAKINDFGIDRVSLSECIGSRIDRITEWCDEPDVQVEGYIVHSARSLNGNAANCQSVNKTFHKTRAEAFTNAKQLADRWKLGHEGLIVFKAVAHIKKVEKRTTCYSPTRTRIATTTLE